MSRSTYVIQRSVGEGITIEGSNGITITLMGVAGGRAKLSVQLPRALKIDRIDRKKSLEENGESLTDEALPVKKL